MRYEIFGDTLPAVTVHLGMGESMYTQSGGMSWMTDQIQMETNMKGGLMKGLGRMMSGESLFMATYTAHGQNQSITFASSFPGHILPIDLSGGFELICQKSAFLAAEPGVVLSASINKKLAGGFFGGEGFIMQHLAGQGTAFLEFDGSVQEMMLAPGEKLIVDTGNVAAYEASIGYSAEMVKGFKNVLFGGEGLFLTTLTGPGKVYLQTMNLPEFAGRISAFFATGK